MSKPATLAPSSWSHPATLRGDRSRAEFHAIRSPDGRDEQPALVRSAPVAATAASPTGRLVLEAALAVALACWGAASAVQEAMASTPSVAATGTPAFREVAARHSAVENGR